MHRCNNNTSFYHNYNDIFDYIHLVNNRSNSKIEMTKINKNRNIMLTIRLLCI